MPLSSTPTPDSELALPLELVKATEHHGPYICNGYGGTVCDFYTMSIPQALSTANGGPSRPISFTDADKYSALIVKSVNAFEPMREALRELVVALTHDDNPQNEFVRTRLIDARAALKLAGDATTNSQEPII